MAKGYFLTNEIKMLISKIHDEHPDWGPTKTREELVRVLRKTGLYKNFDKNWPSVSAVGSVLRPMKKKESELGPDPHDNPWTIPSMAQYPIPPEALPSVLQVWFFMQEWDTLTLTIREAQWVARLYAAIKDIEALCGLSRIIAFKEKYLESAGIGLIVSQMDNLNVFSSMTGHIITLEEEKRLYGFSEEMWRQMERLWPELRDEPVLEGKRPLQLGIRYEKIERRKKEAKNERKHKRNKNEGRHNKTR